MRRRAFLHLLAAQSRRPNIIIIVADAIMGRRPGAGGEAESASGEVSGDALEGLPEYPHYTRPPEYRGWGVPEVLLSGDHARVREWRLEESRRRGAEPNT